MNISKCPDTDILNWSEFIPRGGGSTPQSKSHGWKGSPGDDHAGPLLHCRCHAKPTSAFGINTTECKDIFYQINSILTDSLTALHGHLQK